MVLSVILWYYQMMKQRKSQGVPSCGTIWKSRRNTCSRYLTLNILIMCSVNCSITFNIFCGHLSLCKLALEHDHLLNEKFGSSITSLLCLISSNTCGLSSIFQLCDSHLVIAIFVNSLKETILVTALCFQWASSPITPGPRSESNIPQWSGNSCVEPAFWGPLTWKERILIRSLLKWSTWVLHKAFEPPWSKKLPQNWALLLSENSDVSTAGCWKKGWNAGLTVCLASYNYRQTRGHSPLLFRKEKKMHMLIPTYLHFTYFSKISSEQTTILWQYSLLRTPLRILITHIAFLSPAAIHSSPRAIYETQARQKTLCANRLTPSTLSQRTVSLRGAFFMQMNRPDR